MFNLNGNIILVIGGRGYLGRDFCQKLRSQGAVVISADMATQSKAASKSKFHEEYDDIVQMDIDCTSKESISMLVDQIIKRYKRIDTLVYSVTTKPDDFYYPYTECSLEGWQKVTQVELDGLFLSSQICGKVMEDQGFGNMIFIGSIYGVVGNDQRIYKDSNLSDLYGSGNLKQNQVFSHAVYPVVKGGIISLVRYLAAYWGEKQIRVNCVSPGGVEHEGENSQFLKKYTEKVPLQRKASLDDISGAIVYLASNESSYITGQNLIIDGGWTSW